MKDRALDLLLWIVLWHLLPHPCLCMPSSEFLVPSSEFLVPLSEQVWAAQARALHSRSVEQSGV
jgi:hypothetical protein